MSLSRTPWSAIVAFVVISFGLAWLVTLPLWLGDGLTSPLATLALVGMMFTPALATLIVTFVFRVPTQSRARFLGLWPLRPAKRVIGLTVASIFLPLVIVLAGIAVSAAAGWVQLDLVGFSGFAATLDSLGAGAPPLPVGMIVALQLVSIPIAALINSIAAFGEELGWRGWLLPALRPLGTWPALLISGALWGLWHSPAILLGYNFGLTDISGVALMTLACTAWGVLFGWLRLRSGSVWPAVFGHGALNAAGGTILLLVAAGAPIDTTLAGPLGAGTLIVVVCVSIVLAATGQFGRQPELAAAKGAVPAGAVSTSGSTPAA